MSDFGDWLQNNGVDLARLFVQIGLLGAVIWYSKKLLRTLRASQEQLGALLRLSVSDGAAHQQPSRETSIPESVHSTPEMPEEYAPKHAYPTASAPASSAALANPSPLQSYSHNSILGPIHEFGERSAISERDQSLGGRVAAGNGHAAATMLEEPPASAPSEMPPLTPWVGAPVNSPADTGRGPVAAAMQWLQQPPAPRRKRSGNPFKKVLRWLQTPARS